MAALIDRRAVETFWNALLDRIGREGLSAFRPQIPSRTLQQALTYEIVGRAGFSPTQHPTVYISLPHYWAAFVHDGRPAVHPVNARFLVWFAEPRDDPRTEGTRNYPVRKSDVRRLSPQAWEYGLEQNRINKKAGLPPYMIVTVSSGPVTANRFFSDFTDQFANLIEPLIASEFEKFVKTMFPTKTIVAKPLRIKLR